MRTRAERRKEAVKELIKRIKNCKVAFCYNENDEEYIKHKRDIPHSLGSNYWNGYKTKAMKNKKDRLEGRQKLKQEIFYEE